jgi:hypothetical protein
VGVAGSRAFRCGGQTWGNRRLMLIENGRPVKRASVLKGTEARCLFVLPRYV